MKEKDRSGKEIQILEVKNADVADPAGFRQNRKRQSERNPRGGVF